MEEKKRGGISWMEMDFQNNNRDKKKQLKIVIFNIVYRQMMGYFISLQQKH